MFRYLLCAAMLLTSVHGASTVTAPMKSSDAGVARGRYLVSIAGCNDCHTPGFAQNGGATPPSEWLTGDALGWNGPWGTSYAANLRLRLSQMNEREWLSYARGLNARPPMPNGILHAMTDADLRAIWRFVRFPGATGTPAPSALPPGVEPVGPVVRFPTSPVAG